MGKDRTPRDEHGEHEDDQPGRPRPAQDPAKQREHYEQQEHDATGSSPSWGYKVKKRMGKIVGESVQPW